MIYNESGIHSRILVQNCHVQVAVDGVRPMDPPRFPACMHWHSDLYTELKCLMFRCATRAGCHRLISDIRNGSPAYVYHRRILCRFSLGQKRLPSTVQETPTLVIQQRSLVALGNLVVQPNPHVWRVARFCSDAAFYCDVTLECDTHVVLFVAVAAAA